MRDNKNTGIVNLLNLPNRSPVRTPKVETQITPELTTAEILMNMAPLNLPKSVPEKKDKFGYTKKQNREIENQLIRPKLENSKILKDNINSLPKNKIEKPYYLYNPVKNTLEDVNHPDFAKKTPPKKKLDDDVNDPRGPITKKFDNKKISALDYIEKVKSNYNEPGSERFVNKTLNKFENRTDNKDVVTFNPTTQLFTDETRNIAFKSYDQAKRWNDVIEKTKEMRKTESVNQPNKHRRLK